MLSGRSGLACLTPSWRSKRMATEINNKKKNRKILKTTARIVVIRIKENNNGNNDINRYLYVIVETILLAGIVYQ